MSEAKDRITDEEHAPEYLQPQSKAEIVPIQRGQINFQPLDFTAEQIALIKRMHSAAGLTDDEFMAFMHFCRRKRVDPLLKQAYATKRRMKDGTSVVAIMTSIEGLRSIADRTQDYCPGNEPEFVFDEKNKLQAAKVSVKKYVRGEWHELKGVAYFSEFNQGNFMWEKMPKNQLAKCAEAQALRKGWPEDCGGFYVPEEFNQEVQDEVAPKKTRERASLSKLKKSDDSPNRGHGNEGIKEALEVPGVQKGTDNLKYTIISGSIIKAFYHESKDETKKWVEVTINKNANNSGLVTLSCWHRSLFECLLKKPNQVTLSVKNLEGQKGSPTIEDVLSVDGVKYVKGAPEVKETPIEPIVELAREQLKQPLKRGERERRDESVLELSQLFEKLWPAKDATVKPLRNAVGQMLFALEKKEQLMDLSYPQIKIDAALIALRKYLSMDTKPTSNAAIINEIEVKFKAELEELQVREIGPGDLFA